MRGKTVLAAGALVIARFGFAAPALGAHHLIKIREVFPGTIAEPGAEFVELQMYSGSQNDLAPSSRLSFFDGDGVMVHEVSPTDVTSGQNQRTSLIATAGAEALFTVGADTTYAEDAMSPAGGAVQFTSTTLGVIDCVAWGAITFPPACAGTPAPAIPDGSSLERSIAAGCGSLLEAVDDTNDSAQDFAPQASPTPRANATAPSEAPCPNTAFTKTPKAKTTDRTPKFKFKSVPEDDLATFECRLDGAPYEDCASPHKPGRLARGKHKMRVRATIGLGTDPSPAKHTWKIVKS